MNACQISLLKFVCTRIDILSTIPSIITVCFRFVSHLHALWPPNAETNPPNSYALNRRISYFSLRGGSDILLTVSFKWSSRGPLGLDDRSSSCDLLSSLLLVPSLTPWPSDGASCCWAPVDLSGSGDWRPSFCADILFEFVGGLFVSGISQWTCEMFDGRSRSNCWIRMLFYPTKAEYVILESIPLQQWMGKAALISNVLNQSNIYRLLYALDFPR